MSDVQQSTARPSPVPAALDAHRAAKDRRARFAAAAERPTPAPAPIMTPAVAKPPAPVPEREPIVYRDEQPAFPAVARERIGGVYAEALARVESAMFSLASRREEILRAAGAITGRPKMVFLSDIKRLVAAYFNCPRVDMDSNRRTARFVRIRHIGFYLARMHTTASLPAIGRAFGGRDHTTVLHGVRKIITLLPNDLALQAHVGALSAKIEALQ